MSEHKPSRRAVIASGLAVLSSGCSSLDSPSQEDSDISCEYEAEAGPFDPAKELLPNYSPARRTLAVRAIRQENVTAFYGPRPLKNDSYVVLDGEFYNVFLEDSHTKELPAPLMTVEWKSGRAAPEETTLYSFADLPKADQLALRSVVYGGIYRSQNHPETRLIHSASPVPYPDGAQMSDLSVNDSVWVHWDDRAYEVTVHRETKMEKLVHEYVANKVAANAEAFKNRIAEQHLAQLDNLTPEERTILDEAISGRFHRETQSCFSPYHRLKDRLPEQTVPESGGRWYIEYEGKRYGLDTSFVCSGAWCP